MVYSAHSEHKDRVSSYPDELPHVLQTLMEDIVQLLQGLKSEDRILKEKKQNQKQTQPN